jgi:hypothetical protein
MKECQKIRKDFVAFLDEELGKTSQEQVSAHLKECSSCGQEMKNLSQIYGCAQSVHRDVEQAMDAVDWEALSRRISEVAFQKRQPAIFKSWRKRWLLFFPKLRPVYAGLLAGVLLGALATFLIFRSSIVQPSRERAFYASGEFLESVEMEMARRQTLDYLEKSQYLLLDFLQPAVEKPAGAWESRFASEKARDLLAKKKYLNRELDKFQMAKAREICDQIELLFLELAQLSDTLTEAERLEIQRFIEERNILLKIKLLKKELERNEV